MDNPDLCSPDSTYYRDLLPVVSEEIFGNSVEFTGLYFMHSPMIMRIFIMCCVWIVMGLAISLHLAKTIDVSTGFTVGAFILAVPAILLAVVSQVKVEPTR